MQQMKLGTGKCRLDVRKQARRNDQVTDRRGLDESDPARICDTTGGWPTKRQGERNRVTYIAIQNTLQPRRPRHSHYTVGATVRIEWVSRQTTNIALSLSQPRHAP
jgi:hypothetical protein